MMMLLLLVLLLFHAAIPFSAKPSSFSNLFGIWKLQTTETKKERLLRISEDGTFSECSDDDGYGSTRGLLHGLWDFKESENTILLAVESEKEPLNLEGTLDESSMTSDDAQQVNLAVKGKAYTGVRLHPRTHPSYFELYQPKQTDTFTLRQVLGRLFVFPSITETEDDAIDKPKFQQSDLHGKHFWLAVASLPNKSRSTTLQQQQKSVQDIMRQEAVDIRIMPIDFHQNNTFCATGVDKILRGRFGISDTRRDELWFQVSLFGAGRSVSGSVYSEGKGLTHEDRRSYQGRIIRDNGGLLVEGDVFIGSDLGSDARPEPVAVFTLKERTMGENQSGDIEFGELGAFE